jgi:Ca2+:H+ antiporter
MTSSTVELAVAAFALRGGLIVMVQAAMLGAILNNLLLVRASMFGLYHGPKKSLLVSNQKGGGTDLTI